MSPDAWFRLKVSVCSFICGVFFVVGCVRASEGMWVRTGFWFAMAAGWAWGAWTADLPADLVVSSGAEAPHEEKP